MGHTCENPRVSILLPAFNAGPTLDACLRSIRRQTLEAWECILVDDGSTDGSIERARALAGPDPRMRVVSRPHLGLIPALNAGLERCRGPFIARMDADDLMHRHRLGDQLELLESRPELAAVGCHVRMFPRAEAGPGYREYERWLNGIDSEQRVAEDAYIECPVAHPTLMARAPILRRLRYRARGWAEDYDLVLRMLGRGMRIGVLPARRLCWRLGQQRLSRVSEVYSNEAFVTCKAAFLAATFLAAHERYALWGYGGTGRAISAALARLGKLPAYVIEVHPGRLGNRIRGALVHPPSDLPRLPRLPLIASVAGLGPRAQVRDALRGFGYVDGKDFICAA